MSNKSFIHHFKYQLIGVAVLSFATNILALAPTIYMLQIFDRIMLSRNEISLFILSVIIVIVIGILALSELIRSRQLIRIGINIDKKLNSIFFNSYLNKYLKNEVKKMDEFSEFTHLRQFFTGGAVISIFDIPWTLISVIVLYLLHPVLGILGMCFVVIHFLFGFANKVGGVKEANKRRLTEGSEIAFVEDITRRFESIRSMGMLPAISKRWLRAHKVSLEGEMHFKNRIFQVQAYSKFIQYSQQSIVLSVAAWLVMQEQISIGAMIAANVLMANALRPVAILVSNLSEIKNIRQTFKNINELLFSESIRFKDKSSIKIQGDITVTDFIAFENANTSSILNKINIEFFQGEIVVILGTSGSGKSTFLKSLQGIWPFSSGLIRYGQIDIVSCDRDQVGSQIGYLPQDVDLLPGTVAENICRFSQIDTDAVIQAAKLSDVHDLISKLPLGYNTLIRPGTFELSGGQSQRIGLARALYGLPDYIFLDEPNSKLDDEGEQALVNAITHIKKYKKTVFIVTHQLKFLNLADKVLILNDGVIKKFGSCEEFLYDPTSLETVTSN
jgi:ATP-binding cassette subfamily C exporter for protease/lipase